MEELEQDENFTDIYSCLHKSDKDVTPTQQRAYNGKRVADFEIRNEDPKTYLAGRVLVFVVPKAVTQSAFREPHAGKFAGHFIHVKCWTMWA